ncbi:hypothetical protein BZA77DRAFT_376878 [Pyronema omphalodes]|nr:hypothetical protein BZA77DRAFT_376878 [Pyronema omphalodes]
MPKTYDKKIQTPKKYMQTVIIHNIITPPPPRLVSNCISISSFPYPHIINPFPSPHSILSISYPYLIIITHLYHLPSPSIPLHPPPFPLLSSSQPHPFHSPILTLIPYPSLLPLAPNPLPRSTTSPSLNNLPQNPHFHPGGFLLQPKVLPDIVKIIASDSCGGLWGCY